MDNVHTSFLNLQRAIEKQRSQKWCLALWAAFIKLRDDYRCINCGSRNRVNAHHIFRKTVLRAAELQTGNGATLCRRCHRKIHYVFNGRPLEGEPLNARGGDDQDYIASLYHALERDAQNRHAYNEEYYFLSDEVLNIFRKYQQLPDIPLQGTRIMQAHNIWQMMPVPSYKYLAEIVLYNLLRNNMNYDI